MNEPEQLWWPSDLTDDQRALYDQLIQALQKDDQKQVIELIRRGAPLNVLDDQDRTPLHRACFNKMAEAALTMIEHDAPLDAQHEIGTPIYLACLARLEDVSLAMIEKGASLDVENFAGEGPLFKAIENKMERVALKMIEKGAPLNTQNIGLETPLHVACKSAHGLESVALELIKKDVPLDVQDKDGYTPLHYACMFGLESAALEMIKKAAPLDKQDSHLQTPLHLAYKGHSERLALKMIEKGASLTDQEKKYRTPPAMLGNAEDMYAAFRRHVLIPAMLAEAGNVPYGTYVGGYMWELTNFSAQAMAERMHPIPEYRHDTDEALSDSIAATLMRRIRLSRSWHHPPVTFPNELQPYLPNRHWQPLISEDFTDAQTKLRVVNLTSSHELSEESRALGHCVGKSDYDAKCCRLDPEQRSHIFSIRTEDGLPVSTVEIKLEAQSDGGRRMKVLQHEGKNYGNPSENAVKAWQAFEQAVSEGKVQLAPEDKLGELDKATHQGIPGILQYIGFEPTWENINKALDEYKMPYRRASLAGNDRRLQYDDVKTEDGYAHPHHFIDGYVELDKHNVPVDNSFRLYPEDMPEKLASEHSIVSVRELDAKSWLRATGLMDHIHREIQEKFGADRKRTAQWEREAKEPVTFREVPTPKYKITNAARKQQQALKQEEAGEIRRTYMG